MTLVKMCGLRSERDMGYALEAGADMVGMVLSTGYRRSVPPDIAERMAAMVPDGVVLVGVFVDEPAEKVEEAVEKYGLDAVQLHGCEDDEYVSRIRRTTGALVMRSFVIRSQDDLDAARESSADLVLLDGGAGSGRAFDWTLAEGLGRDFVLAGGLDSSNVVQAIRKARPYAVDASSGIEIDGAKDLQRMRNFTESARAADRTEDAK